MNFITHLVCFDYVPAPIDRARQFREAWYCCLSTIPWHTQNIVSMKYWKRRHHVYITVVLNLWAMTPLKVWLDNLFPGVTQDHWKPQILTLQFTVVARLHLRSSNDNDFMVGAHQQMRNCSKWYQP